MKVAIQLFILSIPHAQKHCPSDGSASEINANYIVGVYQLAFLSLPASFLYCFRCWFLLIPEKGTNIFLPHAWSLSGVASLARGPRCVL